MSDDPELTPDVPDDIELSADVRMRLDAFFAGVHLNEEDEEEIAHQLVEEDPALAEAVLAEILTEKIRTLRGESGEGPATV